MRKSVNLSIYNKRKIVEKINNFSKEVHMEIFYFLKEKMKYNYTINQNGVFINLNDLDNKTLNELNKRVEFYNKNEKKLNETYHNRYCSIKD